MADATLILRGSPERETDHKEAFQRGFVRSIAAAAGAVELTPDIDEGVDLMFSHRADEHVGGKSYVEVQLKATAQERNLAEDVVRAKMTRKRYDYFRQVEPTVNKIVVILALPAGVGDWVRASHDGLLLRDCAYWVNIAGEPEVEAEEIVVSAPRTNVFDDVALCEIMSRIGQGGVP